MMNAPVIANELDRAAKEIREGKLASISLHWTAPATIIGDFIISRDPNKLRSPDEHDIAYANKLADLAAKCRVHPDKVSSILVAWPARPGDKDKEPQPERFDIAWTTP